MRATKDSGVDWLGEVPAQWETSPLRTLMKLRNERNTFYRSDNYLSLMANVGIIPYAEKGDVGNKAPEDLGKCKIVSEGDFVLNSMNFGIGSFGVSAYNGVCSSVYVVMEPRLEKAFPSFLRYIFSMQPFQKHVQSLGNGILEHRAAIGWDELKNIGFPMPDRDEQRRIADFLDRETAKIDALIAKQEQLVIAFDERRQAVLSKLVTRGLIEKRPMRDSGVEWLGEVPADWDIKPLKSLCSLTNSGVWGEEPEDSSNGKIMPVATTAQITRHGDFVLDEMQLRSLTAAEVKVGSVSLGDIVVVKSSGSADNIISGKAGFVREIDSFCFGNFLMRLRARPSIDSRFLFYFLTSDLTRQRIERMVSTTTYPNLKVNQYASAMIPVPPKQEQKSIADFLDRENEGVSEAIAQATRWKRVLLERRNALISAAVTGKLGLSV